MRKGWVDIDDFRKWEEGHGVIYAALNFTDKIDAYQVFHDVSSNPSYISSVDKVSTYIFSNFDLETLTLDTIKDFCNRLYTDISSLSKLSTLEWFSIALAEKFTSMLPEYNRNFNAFYQTYEAICSSLISCNNIDSIGYRHLREIATHISKLPFFSGVIPDGERLFLISLLDVVETTKSNIKSLRLLEYTSFSDVNNIHADSFAGHVFMLNYMFQRIAIGKGDHVLEYRRTQLDDPEHLQNSMVKAWRIIHHNKTLHAKGYSVFADISRQGRGPTASSVLNTPVGSILAYAAVQALEYRGDIYYVSDDFETETDYLKDLYFRLSIRLDRYDIRATELRSILDEELEINNEVVDDSLLANLNFISSCHNRVRNTMLSTTPKRTVTALVIGDSVTAGFGVNEPVSHLDDIYHYPQRVAAMIAHHAVDSVIVANASLVGSVTEDGVRSIDEMLKVHNPKVVVLTQGGNDAISAGLDTSLTKSSEQKALATVLNIRKNWEAMIESCLNFNSSMFIVLSLRIPDAGLFTLHREINEVLNLEVFEPLKAKFPDNVFFSSLPDEPFAFNDEMRLSDGIHLSAKANQMLAQEMVKTLKMVGTQMARMAALSCSTSPQSTTLTFANRCRGMSHAEDTVTRCVVNGHDDRELDFERFVEEINCGVLPVADEGTVDPYGLALHEAIKENMVDNRRKNRYL